MLIRMLEIYFMGQSVTEDPSIYMSIVYVHIIFTLHYFGQIPIKHAF